MLDKIKQLFNKKAEFEHCVICKIETNVLKNLHVDYRYHYIEGAGQLCKDCWDKLYIK